MALNFEFVVSNQLLSVVLASCKRFKISAPGVGMQHVTAGFPFLINQANFYGFEVITMSIALVITRDE